MISQLVQEIQQKKFKKALERIFWAIKLRLLKGILMGKSPYTFYRWLAHPMHHYRENEEAILAGNVPARYTRLASLVPGSRVLEIGPGEGVLALLLAQEKEKVFTVDISPFFHKKALALQEAWLKKGFDVAGCEMILGNFKDHLDLLKQVDTVVAVNCIYYFQKDIPSIFKAISQHATYVMLSGSTQRGEQYARLKEQAPDVGVYNYYASLEGMESLLRDHGYEIIKSIDQEIEDGNQPVVVGRKVQP